MENSDIVRIVDAFWETIPPAWHRTRAYIRQVAADRYRLTVEQFQVLRRIRKGIASVSDLAQASQTSRSAVSKAVDALVQKGFVRRDQNPNDRRNLPLSLTNDGQVVMSGIYREAESWLTTRFQRLNPEETELLGKAMELLLKVFSDETNGPDQS